MRVLVTHEELTALIKQSDHTHSVEAFFGPGIVALDDIRPGNEWAIKLLNEMRNPVCI